MIVLLLALLLPMTVSIGSEKQYMRTMLPRFAASQHELVFLAL